MASPTPWYFPVFSCVSADATNDWPCVSQVEGRGESGVSTNVMNLSGYWDMALKALEASVYRFAMLTPAASIFEIIRNVLTVDGMWTWESKISICPVSVGWSTHELSGVIIGVTVAFDVPVETFVALVAFVVPAEMFVVMVTFDVSVEIFVVAVAFGVPAETLVMTVVFDSFTEMFSPLEGCPGCVQPNSIIPINSTGNMNAARSMHSHSERPI